MTYKGIEIGEKPTLEMIKEYISLRGYELNAREMFIKLDNAGWKKRNGKPIKKLESILDAMNGVYLSFTNNKIKKKKGNINEKKDKTSKKKKTSDYSELLKDPRWQKRRLEIMQRDNFTCQMCGNGLTSGVPLNVHHYVYHKGYLPWEYPDNDLITLCRECHHKLHKEKPNTTRK